MPPTERTRIHVVAGVLTWAVAGLSAFFPASREGPGGGLLPWAFAHVAFLVAFGAAVTPRRAPRTRAAMLAVESISALACVALGRTALPAALLAVVAGQAPRVITSSRARLLVLAQSGALLAVWCARWGAADALVGGGAYVGFQLFALGAATMAARESVAKGELLTAHAALVATQSLLADTARGAERARIARELHDTMGHHLTALSINLEVARNAPAAEVGASVERAHAIAKTLLGDVRDVVAAFRSARAIDLERALRMLVAGVPRPRVHLAVAPLDLRDAAVAHTVFRGVQEALTNALRHAAAENVAIDVRRVGPEVRLRVHDDGRGGADLRAGHGLVGLRERLEALGGRLELVSTPGGGTTLSAAIPAPEEPT